MFNAHKYIYNDRDLLHFIIDAGIIFSSLR